MLDTVANVITVMALLPPQSCINKTPRSTDAFYNKPLVVFSFQEVRVLLLRLHRFITIRKFLLLRARMSRLFCQKNQRSNNTDAWNIAGTSL